MSDEETIQISEPEGGVEIAATPMIVDQEDTTNTDSSEVGIGIGDTILIRGGTYDNSTGVVYFWDSEIIQFMPSGLTNKVITIPFADADELGIEEIALVSKAARSEFIHLLDVRKGEGIETFTKTGEPGPFFKVVDVEEQADRITLLSDLGDTLVLDFDGEGYAGIPREYHSSFEVMRSKELPDEEAIAVAAEIAAEDSTSLDAEQKEGEEAVAGVVVEDLDEEVVLEEEEEVEKELAVKDRIYSDAVQMTDMLAQLMESLTPAQKKNPARLRELGRLVEIMISMRNDVVEYGSTGEPRGLKQTSLQTLADLVQQPTTWLSRKIVNIIKSIYSDHSEEHILKTRHGEKGGDPEGVIQDGIQFDYLEDIIRNHVALEEQMRQKVANAGGGGGPAAGLPRFFLEMEDMREAVQTPYLTTDPVGNAPPLTQDEEVFRAEVPTVGEGTVPALEPSDIIGPMPILKKIGHSVVRLLKRRQVRMLSSEDGNPIRTIEAGEHATSTTSVLFPMYAKRTIESEKGGTKEEWIDISRSLGPIRTKSLARDISLSHSTPQLLSDILKMLGEASEFPTAEGLLAIGIDGNLLGNVSLKDWLEQQDLKILGSGDALQQLRPYGLDECEVNTEQAAVLSQKILQNLAAIRKYLGDKRQEAKTFLESLRFTPNGVLDAASSQRLLDRVVSEPILQKAFEQAKEEYGEIATIDLYWIAYLARKYPDLLIAVLGQQGPIIAKERLNAVRDQYSSNLSDGYALRKKLLTAGEEPTPLKCPHVEELEKVRKVRDDTERMALLTRFFGDWRGRREGNWIYCSNGDHHLLCAHELYMIQQFLRPAEMEILQKEMTLKFADGVFHGKYICKNCGQPMRELDFDTNLEFDDNGMPMMGRSVMVDIDAQKSEELMMLLTMPSSPEDEKDWGSIEANTIYNVLLKITNSIGIAPTEKDYEKMIEQIVAYMKTLMTRAQYAAVTKGQKGVIDYDVYYTRFMISACAAHLVIAIQTHVPDYIPRYIHEECKAGFFGYPLDSESNMTGVECMAGVLAGYMTDEKPWNQTGFQKEANFVKRKGFFMRYIENLIRDFAILPMVQVALKEKREYVSKLYGGEEGELRDQIPQQFRPVPMMISSEEAAATAIVPGAAKQADAVGTAWIRSAHAIARASSSVNPEQPYAETTCCFHDIRRPQEFWEENSPFTLPPKTSSFGARGSIFGMPSKVVKIEALRAKADPGSYYRLFLNVCYDGPRKGLPHEIGLTFRCRWCGLQFPENPNLLQPSPPYSSDKQTQKRLTEEYNDEITKKLDILRASLTSQGAVINEESFQEILDTTHRLHSVESPSHPTVTRPTELLKKISEIEYAPIEGWKERIEECSMNMNAMLAGGGALTDSQITTACEKLVETITQAETNLRKRLGEEVYTLYTKFISRSPQDLGEALNTQFVVPLRRWQTGVSDIVILKSYELSPETIEDIKKGLEGHWKDVSGGIALIGLSKAKVLTILDQFSCACQTVFPMLRSILIPGGSRMTKYICRALVAGPISTLLNPQHIPERYATEVETVVTGVGDTDLRAMYKAIANLFLRANEETFSYSDEQIRLIIASREEKEKELFIKRLDKMSKEEQQVAKRNKLLGIGEWAVGGTKVIREYDPDRYEAERIERANAGIIDYVAPNGREFDALGFNYGAEYDTGGGYDNAQIGEDEY